MYSRSIINKYNSVAGVTIYDSQHGFLSNNNTCAEIIENYNELLLLKESKMSD